MAKKIDRQKEFSEASPSRILEMALEDLEAVEKQPKKYKVDMGDWHRPEVIKGRTVCNVCLAGAVIANRFHVSPAKETAPIDFPDDVNRRLLALDKFRSGQLGTGLHDFGIKINLIPVKFRKYIPVERYWEDAEKFKADMRNFVIALKEAGF